MAAPVYPPPTPGVRRITQSTLQQYLRCGIAWGFQRESKARHATVRMMVGSGVDAGAAEDNREKIVRGTPATLTRIVDAAVAGYEEEAGTSDVPEPASEVAQGKDDTAAAARVFGLEVSPGIEPIAAQVSLVYPVRGIELAGTPDYVTGDGVGDLKVGQPWSQDRADRSRQLTGYAVLHRLHYGRWPGRCWIDSLSFGGGKWRAARLWTRRTAEDASTFLEIVERAAKGMDSGVALPAPEGAWYCADKWCPFFRRCPAVRA